MRIIISEEADKVSDNVMEWLIAANKDAVRLDYEKVLPALAITMGYDDTQISLGHISSKTIESIWHRRARLNFLEQGLQKTSAIKDLQRDEKIVNQFIETYLRSNTGYIGSYIQEVDNNKLEDLEAARKAGFLIPDTLITNRKERLKHFINKHGSIICKQISAGFEIESDTGQLASGGTKMMQERDMDNLPDTFAITLFQAYVPKELEIRIFFFKASFYAMAIFSQRDEQTQIDYRNYNTAKPNRVVPFRLPDEVMEKLSAFNALRNYTTGSFDLILTPEGKYYFLEINPTGQFHWLSANCNYYIEKHIAASL